MKFNRCLWKINEKLVRTPQRVAAARRAVEKDKASIPLFPDMVKHKTVDAKLDDRDSDHDKYARQQRAFANEKWREARRELRGLPKITAAGIIRWWQSDAYFPRDPSYLLDAIHQVKHRHACYWRHMRILYQFKLIQQGKLPKSIIQSLRAWDL